MNQSARIVTANHSLQERREAAGVSQRELSRRTGIAQARLSRHEAGNLELSAGEVARVEAGLQGRDALADAGPAQTPAPGRNESYPAAPDDPAERREWMNRRNAGVQGVPYTGEAHPARCICAACAPQAKAA